MGPKKTKTPDGSGYAITFPLKPDTVLPLIAAQDIGACAAGVFSRPDLIGKTVGIVGDMLTGPQMAAALAEALGKPVAYNAVSADAYRAFGFPGANDLGNMFQFKEEQNAAFCGRRDLELSKALNSGAMLDFKQWLALNAKSIPME